MKNSRWMAAFLVFILAQGTGVWAQTSFQDSPFMDARYSKRISMDFKDAALSEVLKIFSQQSGMNFIAASDVTNKRVTLFIENIPVEEALEKILTANGLVYEIQLGSDIFVVKTKPNADQTLVTRIYQLKYASVPSSKINSTISIGGGAAGGESGGASGGRAAGGAASGGAAGGSGLVSAIRAVLSSYGKMTEDPRTNSLIITDAESQFLVIEDTLKRLDVPIPQILIQVEMLDVSKGTADLIGIKYTDTVFTVTGAKRQVTYPFDLHMLKDKGYEFEDAEYTSGLLDTSTMQAVVQFLETQSDTRNLARPRLLTLNNETAEIQISTDEAIGLETNTNSTSGGTSTQSVEAERVETGVFLLVTPQANLATREIMMAVAPRVIQARRSSEFAQFKDPEERGSQQLMKVKDGETIIIGGLLRTDTSNTVTKLPILGDLPLIGRAFRHTDKAKTERELLIFITPTIIDDQNKEKLLKEPAIALEPDARMGGEQDVPKSRMKQINKDLSSIEQQRF
jgi:type II secretory pathway component GspD/PulD (secretin)